MFEVFYLFSKKINLIEPFMVMEVLEKALEMEKEDLFPAEEDTYDLVAWWEERGFNLKTFSQESKVSQLTLMEAARGKQIRQEKLCFEPCNIGKLEPGYRNLHSSQKRFPR